MREDVSRMAGYQRMVARAGEAAGFSFLIHSHIGIAAVTSLPMTARTPGQSSTTWVTAALRPRYDTRPWHPTDSSIFGRTELSPNGATSSSAGKQRPQQHGKCSLGGRNGTRHEPTQ
jgi:hypothetical protein